MNIIVVSGASARVRTMTLEWRHLLAGSFAFFTLLATLAVLVNYAALKWAASTGSGWLVNLALADQREEAQRTHERVTGHLNAMAIRLGELQARLMRLDGLGERLAAIAGLKPHEWSALQAKPETGGVLWPRSQPLSIDEFTSLIDHFSGQVDARSDRLGELESLLVETSANRNFVPTRSPIADGWFSSNFGYRIDPFTGQRAFHDGIDFAADAGTPILAAASGKVVSADFHPEYGRLVEIDHGNGLVTRYAHASFVLVRRGDVVVAGQRIASVGSTGRATGPHLHFEVRLKGVAQNPARFLDNRGIRVAWLKGR